MQKINKYSHLDTTPGSILHFSARFLSQQQKAAIFAICDFYQTIENITLQSTDPQVTHIQLNWWRDQVIQMHDGAPDHPLMQTLQKNVVFFQFNPLRLIEVIDGLEQNLTLPVFAKFEDVVIHLMRTAGVRELLIADVIEKNHSVASEEIYHFMLVIELVQHLQHARRYLRKGLVYFSQEELQQFHVTETALQQFQTTAAIKNLLQFQVEKIQRSYQKTKEFANKDRRFFSARCAVANAILQAISDSDFRVLENFITITPLKCWWVTLKKHNN